jgi:hypothetical protein
MAEDKVNNVKGIERFFGKQVIVQLQGGEPWMGVCSEDGEPAPIMLKGQDGKPSLMHAPFFQGVIVGHEPPFLLVEYLDQNKSKMFQAFHQDVVSGITMVLEQVAVHIIQP